jgi:hypothetical protein
MTFPKQEGRPFTLAAVMVINPNQVGVYGLYKADRWIYIGKGDIRQRLLDHLNGHNPRIIAERPTSWVAELTQDMDEREKQLIAELNPICNQRLG